MPDKEESLHSLQNITTFCLSLDFRNSRKEVEAKFKIFKAEPHSRPEVAAQDPGQGGG